MSVFNVLKGICIPCIVIKTIREPHNVENASCEWKSRAVLRRTLPQGTDSTTTQSVFVQLARRGRTELAKCKIPFSPCHHSTLPCQLYLRHSLSTISIKKQDTGKFHCWKADHILYSASPCHDAPYKISNVVFSTFVWYNQKMWNNKTRGALVSLMGTE